MAPSQTQLRAAAALGAVSGQRTFGAWVGLAARDRVGGRLRAALLTAAAGEIVVDKLPFMRPRSEPPALAGRIVSGALAGRVVGGAHGALIGGAAAAAVTYPSQRARALIGERTGVADLALGAAEDVLVMGTATVAAGVSERATDGDRQPDPEAAADAAPEPRSRVGSLARGLIAGAAGTAAMTTVQNAYLMTTGGEPSSAPGDVGRKLLRETTGRRVPRRRRAAFNQTMHVLYGTAWGGPLGLAERSRPSAAHSAILGLGFGTAVWSVSLVELALLGIAPVPWRQPASALLADLGFHLVYGTTTAAVHGALVA
jgi:uncharacterized membrane protein